MAGERKSRAPYKVPAGHSDRKSASGMSGDPKKGGRGGKFTWEGADGYTDEDLGLIGNKAAGAVPAAATTNKIKSQGDDDSSDEEWAKVEEDSRRALALDDTLVKGHYLLRCALLKKEECALAVKEFDKGLDLLKSSNSRDKMAEDIWQVLAKAKYLD